MLKISIPVTNRKTIRIIFFKFNSSTLIINKQSSCALFYRIFGFASLKCTMATTTKSMKPPNILIYTGENEDKDSALKYSSIKALLEDCVNRDAYTVYPLKHNQLFSTPWQENAALLVNACQNATKNVDALILDFLLKDANVLSFRSSLENKLVNLKDSATPNCLVKVRYGELGDVSLISSQNFFSTEDPQPMNDLSSMEVLCSNEDNGESVIALVTLENQKAVLVQVCLDEHSLGVNSSHSDFSALKQSNSHRLEIVHDLLLKLDIDCSSEKFPNLSPGYLLAFSEEIKNNFIASFRGKMKGSHLQSKNMTLHFVESELGGKSVTVTPECLPVFTESPKISKYQYFDCDSYWRNLETRSLGSVLLYVDVIPTTMQILDGFMFTAPENVGVIAVAGRQTAGKGRGGNSWLSPIGCAMFSLHIRIDVNSELGHKASFLQHIISLAVVQSVCSLQGCENIPLNLKWPNDIYYDRKMKLGGVIVNSSMMGSTIHANVGCGFNVSNSNPTICINDIILNYNAEHDTKLPPCTTDQLIARTVTKIESLIDLFQNQGSEEFCRHYYKYWIHSGNKVKVESLDYSEVTITGLDDFGFLQVLMDNGELCSLQPDGNSLDIMHNLIAIKKHL